MSDGVSVSPLGRSHEEIYVVLESPGILYISIGLVRADRSVTARNARRLDFAVNVDGGNAHHGDRRVFGGYREVGVISLSRFTLLGVDHLWDESSRVGSYSEREIPFKSIVSSIPAQEIINMWRA